MSLQRPQAQSRSRVYVRDLAEGKEVSGIPKSTDFGRTNAERSSLRETEAPEVMSDHNHAEKAFHDNRERLRTARLAREAVAGQCFIQPWAFRMRRLTSAFQQGSRTRSMRLA
jgi:hypothetical protein